MARSCIYCGRTLQAGEKCNCQAASAHTRGKPGQTEPESSKQAHQAGPESDAGSKRWSDTEKHKQQQNKTGHTGSTRSTPFNRTTADRRAAFMRSLPVILARFQTVTRYVLQPVDAIRSNVHQPSIKRTFINFVIQSILSGLMMMSLSRYPAILAILGWSPVTARPAYLFVSGAVLSLAAILILGLAYQLMLRYIHRKPFPFQKIAEALGPVSLYMNLFLIFSLLSLRTSLITASVILLSGMMVSLLVQFFSFRQLTAMEENRLVMLVFSASFLSMSLIGLLAGLA